jgi:hypothetical protein
MPMNDADERVVVIAASILVARHLKTIEEFRDSKPSPRTQSLVLWNGRRGSCSM